MACQHEGHHLRQRKWNRKLCDLSCIIQLHDAITKLIVHTRKNRCLDFENRITRLLDYLSLDPLKNDLAPVMCTFKCMQRIHIETVEFNNLEDCHVHCGHLLK